MRATLALATALALGACGTQDWAFFDPKTTAIRDAAAVEVSTDSALDGLDADDAAADAADGDACDPSNPSCGAPSCAGGIACPSTAPVCTQPDDLCAGCRSNDDCATVRAGPICAQSGACVPECFSDRQCPSSRPHCARSIGRCVRCLDDADCPQGTVCSSNTLSCVIPH